MSCVTNLFIPTKNIRITKHQQRTEAEKIYAFSSLKKSRVEQC
jgi:hypothetical protein